MKNVDIFVDKALDKEQRKLIKIRKQGTGRIKTKEGPRTYATWRTRVARPDFWALVVSVGAAPDNSTATPTGNVTLT